MGYRLDGLGSNPGKDKRFSVFHSVDSCSGSHPASYPMGIGVKRLGRATDHLPRLVPRPRMVDLYTHFSIRLHGVVLN
jgi:hypothetical protein